jgi:hypothetical protein
MPDEVLGELGIRALPAEKEGVGIGRSNESP